jgi:hypothetical protein
MPFGIETYEIFVLIRQVGLAVAGAASLWGFVFLFRGHKNAKGEPCVIFDWVSTKLLLPCLGGFGLAIVGWIGLMLTIPASAHEGIVITPTYAQVYAALTVMSPLYIAWIVIMLFSLIYLQSESKKKTNGMTVHNKYAVFYAIQFVCATALISFPALSGSGSLDNEQLFFIGHSVH